MLFRITAAARPKKALLVKEHAMRPWVDRVTLSSNALEYIGNLTLNMLIVAGGTLLFIVGVFWFAS